MNSNEETGQNDNPNLASLMADHAKLSVQLASILERVALELMHGHGDGGDHTEELAGLAVLLNALCESQSRLAGAVQDLMYQVRRRVPRRERPEQNN